MKRKKFNLLICFLSFLSFFVFNGSKQGKVADYMITSCGGAGWDRGGLAGALESTVQLCCVGVRSCGG